MRRVLFGAAAAAALIATPVLAKEGAWLKKLETDCNAGDGSACKILGDQLDHDSFGAAEPANARAAYEKGCKLKESQACVGLYSMLSLGRGGPKDLARARQYERLACDLGNVMRYDLRRSGLCED